MTAPSGILHTACGSHPLLLRIATGFVARFGA